MSQTGDKCIIQVDGTAIQEVFRYNPTGRSNRRDVSYTNNAGQKTFRTETSEKGATFSAYFETADTALALLEDGNEVALIIEPNGDSAGEPRISGQFLVTDRSDPGEVNGELVVEITGVFNTYSKVAIP